jgi:hypothetical protein
MQCNSIKRKRSFYGLHKNKLDGSKINLKIKINWIVQCESDKRPVLKSALRSKFEFQISECQFRPSLVRISNFRNTFCSKSHNFKLSLCQTFYKISNRHTYFRTYYKQNFNFLRPVTLLGCSFLVTVILLGAYLG